MHERKHIDGDQSSFSDQFERLGFVEEVGIDFHERSWGFGEKRKIYKSGINLGQIKGGLFERFIYKKVYILVFTLNEGKSPLIYFY